jgi:hypothetical protein
MENLSIVINGKIDYNNFIDKLNTQDFFFHIICCDDDKHDIINNISCIYVYFLKDKQWNILLINHYEKLFDINLNIFLDTNVKKYVLDKKKCLYYFKNIKNLYDLNFCSLEKENTIIKLENITEFNYINCKNKNNIIPYFKYFDKLKEIEHVIIRYVESIHNEYLNKEYTDVCYEIEKNGLFVSESLYIKFFEKHKDLLNNNFIYSKYNLYNITSRPSNSFGGLNFSSLNKDNGERSCFVSRFENDGILVNIDYDACHPHLIANLINYDFQNVDIYSYFKKYFDNADKEVLKPIIFKLLYNEIPDEYLEIPFFNKTKNYIDNIYKISCEKQYIETVVFKRKINLNFIENITPNKLFNYVIQSIETEFNILILNEVLKYMQNLKSKIILYMYDSILLDLHISEKNILNDITNIMSKNNRPVSLKYGKNFHDMKKIDINKKRGNIIL